MLISNKHMKTPTGKISPHCSPLFIKKKKNESTHICFAADTKAATMTKAPNEAKGSSWK